MGRQLPFRAVVGASFPAGGKGLRLRARWGLSPEQTIGAARTAVRSAGDLPQIHFCFLPEFMLK